MSLRIGIAGITGRVGKLLVEEVAAAGAVLAGGTRGSGGGEAPLFPNVAALAVASDVVIDFTRAAAVQQHAAVLAEALTPWVLGTSGLSAADEMAVSEAARRVAIVYAANFAPGVTVVEALAERLAAALPPESYDAEIVEMHHRQKVDAPSGTAIALGRAVARGRGVALEQVMRSGRTAIPALAQLARLVSPLCGAAKWLGSIVYSLREQMSISLSYIGPLIAEPLRQAPCAPLPG